MLAQHERESLCQLVCLVPEKDERFLCAISVRIRQERVASPSSNAELRKKTYRDKLLFDLFEAGPCTWGGYFKAEAFPQRCKNSRILDLRGITSG